jgi:hypothetical protein
MNSVFGTEEVVQEINLRSIQEQHANRIWRKGDLVRDFEDFNFLHFEMLRTREKRVLVQSDVVGVTLAKVFNMTVTILLLLLETPKIGTWKIEFRVSNGSDERGGESFYVHPNVEQDQAS